MLHTVVVNQWFHTKTKKNCFLQRFDVLTYGLEKIETEILYQGFKMRKNYNNFI